MNAIDFSPTRLRLETRMRLLRVVRAVALSPHMRRIVLGGEDLAGFNSPAPDDHVKLFFPAPGQDKPVLPAMGQGGRRSAEAAAPVMRDYTPRRYDAQTGELTIDFVLHGDGPASAWAAQAAPGHWLGVGGPRGSTVVSDAFDFYLLVGDESALPAIGRWLEEMRPGTAARAIIEVADAAEERALPTAANAEITWLHRNGAPAGTATALLDALRAATLPPGHTHAWLAGEMETMRALRAHLLNDRGLAKEHVRATGYWRSGTADSHGKIED